MFTMTDSTAARAATTPTAEVDAWAAEHSDRALRNVIGHLRHAPIDAVTLWLEQACRNGLGMWLVPPDPAQGDRGIRPATHMVEISVLGVIGRGATVEEATRSWRRAALNLTAEGGA